MCFVLGRTPDFDMSELESLFSAAAPVASVAAGDKAGKKSPAKQEKVHLVWSQLIVHLSWLLPDDQFT